MATSHRKQASFVWGSEEVYSLVCLPCHRDDISRPAQGYCTDCQEHLCHECYKNHRKPAPCRHHKLQDEDTMPSTQQLTDGPVKSGTTDTITTPCPHHNTEMIKFYCHSHKMLLCSICVAQKHTKSCHVDYIPGVSDEIINSLDYKHTIDRMDKILKKCTSIQTETSTEAKLCQDSLNIALHELQTYKEEVNELLDEQQNKLEAQIEDLQHQTNQQLQSVEAISKDITKMLNVACDSMKQLNQSKQSNKLYVQVKQVQNDLLEHYEQSIVALDTADSIKEYAFVPSPALNDVLQQENMIGDIKAKHPTTPSSQDNMIGDIEAKHRTKKDLASQGNIVPSSADHTDTPTCLGEICVKSPEDKKRCWITGMTMLPRNRLVLADRNNNSIKLVDVNSKSIISRLSLDTEDEDKPWDITSTSSTQIAVTVPYRQYIQFLSVSKPSWSFQDKLSKSHTIKTEGLCWGICCHQDKLIVSYQLPCKLEILDMRGRMITRVTTDSTGKDIFNQPWFVQANSSSIYVSDWRANMIIMLNWNGEITGRIRDIGCPRGLALLHDASLLFCDEGYGKVYHVAAGGTNCRIVLEDVKRPWAVYVDDGGHKLYISRRTQKDKPDNNILIYNT